MEQNSIERDCRWNNLLEYNSIERDCRWVADRNACKHVSVLKKKGGILCLFLLNNGLFQHVTCDFSFLVFKCECMRLFGSVE